MSTAHLDTQESLDRVPEAAQGVGAAVAPAPPAVPPDAQAPQERAPAEPDLARVVAERAEYLEALQRLQAEYDNYRRRMQRELADAGDRRGRQVAEQLLEVLDAFDAAVDHGMNALVPLRRCLQDALTSAGLQRLDPTDAVFDPAEHHAVAHEPAGDVDRSASADDRPRLVEVLRPGYRWKDRLVRPALVHVKG